MRTAICTLKSISPYSQSRGIQSVRDAKENYDEFEARCWRERMHVNETGNVFIPPMAFKNCVDEAAKFTPKKIPGRRNATYTKHFEAGMLVTDGLVLGIKGADVPSERLFLPSDGKRGSGSRVWKMYPLIPEWTGDVAFHIFDDTITKDVFEETVREAGRFIGIGRFRPRNRGFYGRFEVGAVKWQ